MGEPIGAPAAPALQAGSWAGIAGLRHAFFGRAGGSSAGDWASLNVSEQVGDDPAVVARNWDSIAAALPGLRLVRMRQVHGVVVARVERPEQPVGEADAMVSTAAGAGLVVLTADCVPILAVAPEFGAALAVHAGWRGTLAGVAQAALAAARRWYGIEPSAWRVALGPAIGGCCYEVEDGIGRRMVDRWGAMPDAWQPTGAARGQLDLRAVNRRVLAASGVDPGRVEEVGPCTSCAADRFFSHRRSGGRAGRQASIIGWVAPSAAAPGE